MHDIFYFTDVHGNYPLFRAAMDFCMKEDPECTIIFGGDACDRGTSGYKIMKELLDNPQVVYIKGNHEDMFVDAAQLIKNDYHGEINEEQIEDYLNRSAYRGCSTLPIQQCMYNGGYCTLKEWMLDGMPMNFVDKINRLPLTFSYEGIDFCHAGGDPKVFKRVADNEYNAIAPDKGDAEMVLWDRNWLGFGWIPNRTCVFGHTPTPFLPAKYYGQDKSIANAHPCKYVGLIDERLSGYRLDMDTGAINSGRLYVLNCLTMKAYGFKDTDFENKEIRNHDVEQFEVIQF